jgi:hypothetical protein
MLEIKNIVNREITGIPKKEYWTQTQLQMEVCDLDDCDFLETKFIEYSDEESYLNDKNITESSLKEIKMKGIILYFHTKEGKPFYLYKPKYQNVKEREMTKWCEEMIDLYQSKDMIWIKTIYWKLEKLSCVLILRNKKWFEDNISQLQNIWNIIEKERITGFEHRAPNRKNKIEKNVDLKQDFNSGKCLLIKKIDSTNKPLDKPVEKEKTTNYFFRIRTESIDETKMNM